MSHGSGQFSAFAVELRHIYDRLDTMVQHLREDAKESAERETARARVEERLASRMQQVQKEIGSLTSRVERLEAPSLIDTGPNEPRDEVALARTDAAKADAEEKRARARLWTQLLALFGAGGLGAVLRSLLGG